MKDRSGIATSLLKAPVEQVGFVDALSEGISLSMMGGELCVNATLAAAYSTNKLKGVVKIVKNQEVAFMRADQKITAIFNLPNELQMADSNEITILFESIGYQIRNGAVSDIEGLKTVLMKNCRKYGLSAFGLIVRKPNGIQPVVYVIATDSLVYETACGSGSVAYYLTASTANELLSVRQPTGQDIKVKRLSRTEFEVRAQVERV